MIHLFLFKKMGAKALLRWFHVSLFVYVSSSINFYGNKLCFFFFLMRALPFLWLIIHAPFIFQDGRLSVLLNISRLRVNDMVALVFNFVTRVTSRFWEKYLLQKNAKIKKIFSLHKEDITYSPCHIGKLNTKYKNKHSVNRKILLIDCF